MIRIEIPSDLRHFRTKLLGLFWPLFSAEKYLGNGSNVAPQNTKIGGNPEKSPKKVQFRKIVTKKIQIWSRRSGCFRSCLESYILLVGKKATLGPVFRNKIQKSIKFL